MVGSALLGIFIRSLLLGLTITAIFVVIVIFFLAAYLVGSEKDMSDRLPRAVLVFLITVLCILLWRDHRNIQRLIWENKRRRELGSVLI